VLGCTNANGKVTASIVAATVITLNVNCNASQTGLSGTLIQDVTMSAQTNRDYDQCIMFRDSTGFEAKRFGKMRSLSLTNDYFVSAFWGIPRCAASMDGAELIYDTNNGEPDTAYLVKITVPNAPGTAITNNCFGVSKCVTISPNSSTATFTLTSLDASAVTLEISPRRSIRATDSGYVTDSVSGCSTTCDKALATTPATNYYWRAVANNKAVAMGSFNSSSVPSAGISVKGAALIRGAAVVR
jgi:hypothetical protein